jgi:hypothetical protein
VKSNRRLEVTARRTGFASGSCPPTGAVLEIT